MLLPSVVVDSNDLFNARNDWSRAVSSEMRPIPVVIALIIERLKDEISVKPTREIDRDLGQHGGGIYD